MRIVVCVGPSPGSERLVRAAAEMGAPWHAIHVQLTGAPPPSPADHDRVEAHLALAESLGAEIATVDGLAIADAVLAFARERGATRIVAGRSTRWRRSVLDELIQRSGDLEVLMVGGDAQPPRARGPRMRAPLFAYAIALVLVGAATAVGVALGDRLALPDDAMLFLVAIMLAALGGRGPGFAAAAMSVGAYDFFFVHPSYTFAVADPRHLMTFGVMFAAGTAMGTLVVRLRHAADTARQRERRTAALLAFAGEVGKRTEITDLAAAIVAHVEAALGAPACVLLADSYGDLQAVAGLEPLAPTESEVARLAHERVLPAGRGTDQLSDARLLAVPLAFAERSVGVIAVQIERARRRIDREERLLLDAMARQAAIAIARLELAKQAGELALVAKAEELRSSLLSTVSHDLRTPLAIITGTASAQREAGVFDAQALDTIIEESARLETILVNLLAFTRVQSGAQLKREWVPVEELVGAALGRMEEALDGRDVKLAVPPELGVIVDPILVEQVLLNLLDNAIKHTPNASPIEISVVRERDGVAIAVSDRGPGLPPGREDQVFEKFFRGPDVRTTGAGLGLAVCRGIAIAHGGQIEATRRDIAGATFRLWLPGGEAPT